MADLFKKKSYLMNELQDYRSEHRVAKECGSTVFILLLCVMQSGRRSRIIEAFGHTPFDFVPLNNEK